ncbi:MAG: hypothetical protein JWR59_1592 [Brevundimonas sp.]|nr:hypothetical protein [Brevundimonas sp.]
MAASKSSPGKTPARRSKTVAPRPVLQWIAAGLGACVTVGAGAVILYEAVQPVRPVALSVTIKGERRTGSNRIFEIKVINAGSETAAGVEILGQAGGETASVTLDYVPGDGEALAALAFPVDSVAPTLSVAGWSEP